MEKQKIKIVRKNDEYSAEYQVGDVFSGGQYLVWGQ